MLFHDLVLAVASNPVVTRLLTGVPAFQRMARRFVAGDNLDDAVKAIRDLRGLDLDCSLDHLGESVTDPDMARRAAADYVAALERLNQEGLPTHVSVKLTQLGLDLDRDLCLENLRSILTKAGAVGSFVRLDMEGSDYTERTLGIYRELRADFDNVGVVVQAYLLRSQADVESLAASGANIRLCKGAYKEPASIAFPRKADVDASYLRLLQILFRPESLAAGAHVAVATHDDKIITWTRQYTFAHGVPASAFEFQMLYGIRRDLQESLASLGYPVRVYVPYGAQWYPYFSRRLAERPANLLFIMRNLFRG
jgi:proline dehydrogenase